MTALKNAMALRKKFPKSRVSMLFRDLQTSGELNQGDIAGARAMGIDIYTYGPKRPPRTAKQKITFVDGLEGGKQVIPFDLLVLSTPLVPQEDSGRMSEMLGIPRDEFGFFPDTQLKLKPEQYVENGIYICGTAHWPSSVDECMYQAAGAAQRAGNLLGLGKIETDTLAASADEKYCRGCGKCVETCSFRAVALVDEVSKVDPFLCTGCGACVVACPTTAMNLKHYTNDQFLAQIDEVLAAGGSNGGPRILGLCCIWGGYASADLAGVNRIRCPEGLRIIRVGCTARLDPAFVLRAFQAGADGVLLAACPPGECHYHDGNEKCRAMNEDVTRLISILGIDPERLRFEWINADEGERFAQLVDGFSKMLKKLGPSPLRTSGDKQA
jgi:heterodisulfide reductase subunit A